MTSGHNQQQTDAAGGDTYLQSFARGLSVFVAFAPGQERLTIAQVAKATGLTRAGARRILLTLKHLGYVASDKRLFFLTSQVLHLVGGYSPQPVWETTRKVLKSVAEELNETVSAGILDGTEVVYKVRIRSAHLLHLDLKEGARLPAHASSMGRVLLAALPPGSLERYLRTAELTRYTAATVTDPEILRKRVEEVRRKGWCALHGELEDGHSGVSVPLADAAGKTFAALNVGLRSSHATSKMVGKTIVPLLREAARSIAASL